MAEPLKNQYGPEIPQKIAAMISAVHGKFPAKAFLKESLAGYEDLELMPRGWHMAHALRRHLPDQFPEAVDILIASFGPKLDSTERFGMAPFLYMPHAFMISEYGVDHFEPSMRAQYELTQRFTAEYSIRAFLDRHPDKTLARLREWASDPSVHVRRLVSEGTRPRLPWAQRLRGFQKDPQPVLVLLELLKDDPDLYVRRSVANNLNDIGKDHPELLVKTAKRWLKSADENRQWVVRHALRSLVKQGNAAALEVLGFAESSSIQLLQPTIMPVDPRIGEKVTLSFQLMNTGTRTEAVLVDFQIHFVKANGKSNAKVFKLKKLDLDPADTVELQKTISLAELTTRRHYPGTHQIDVLVNGRVMPLGSFELKARR